MCQTTRPWVSKVADRRYRAASLLIGMTSSLLTLLEVHLTQLGRHLDFTRRKQDILRLLTMPASGKTKASDLANLGKSEDKTTLTMLAPCFRFWLLCSCSWHRSEGKYQRILNQNNTQQQIIKNGANFVGQYIEMRTRRVYLSMRTEGIKAFPKRIRRCSVDGRKRYENDKCGRKYFWKPSKTAPFSFENGSVSRVKPAGDRTDVRRLTLLVS